MSLGFEQGIPVAQYAESDGVNPLFSTMPVMLLLLSGTLITTIVWCIWLGIRNNSLKDYIRSDNSKKLSVNYLSGYPCRTAMVQSVYTLWYGEKQDG